MTQGDPLSMVVYALSNLPLIARVSQPNLTQTWFADDAGAGASLLSLFIVGGRHCRKFAPSMDNT